MRCRSRNEFRVTSTARPAAVLLAAVLLSTATIGPTGMPVARAEQPPTGPSAAVLAPTPVIGATAPVPTVQGVAALADDVLTRAALGRYGAVVVDPATQDVLLDIRGGRAQVPASTVKLLTGVAALATLGPERRLTTSVMVDDPSAARVTLTLVGGGDATLTRGALAGMAQQAADAVPVDQVDLRYDASAFAGARLGPGWPKSFPAAGVVAPVSALMVDQGRVRPGARVRVADPARQAAEVFAGQLRAKGLRVQSIRPGRPATGATEVARFESPSVRSLVERMLTDSDNDLAEALAHLVGKQAGTGATFAGGAAATERVVAALGLPAEGLRLVDGSGLSGRDRVSARTLALLLSAVARAQDPATTAVSAGLAVAGFTGTLADRFDSAASRAGAGVVRAKTGTLTGVVSLAGMVRDSDGRVLVFAVLGNKVRSADKGRAALDTFAARLAGCGCR